MCLLVVGCVNIYCDQDKLLLRGVEDLSDKDQLHHGDSPGLPPFSSCSLPFVARGIIAPSPQGEDCCLLGRIARSGVLAGLRTLFIASSLSVAGYEDTTLHICNTSLRFAQASLRASNEEGALKKH